jgi:hypothetical protein
MKKYALVSLAAIVCWHIWMERNKVLFEEDTPSHLSVVHRISVSFSWQPAIINLSRIECVNLSTSRALLWLVSMERPSLPGSVVQQVVFSRLMLRGLPNGT